MIYKDINCGYLRAPAAGIYAPLFEDMRGVLDENGIVAAAVYNYTRNGATIMDVMRDTLEHCAEQDVLTPVLNLMPPVFREEWIASGDPLCERFRNGGFAHTRFAYKAGVVLLAAGEYLYNALQLLFAPDNVIQLSFARALREANAEILQIARSAALLLFFLLGVAGFLLPRGALAPEEGSEVDGGRAAVFVVAVVILRYGHKPGHTFRKRVDILLAHIHLVYDIVYRLYPELLRAFDAEALA